MSEYYAGRVAMVTGAGSGIGRASAVAFAAAGAAVTVVDVDADAAAATVEMVESTGGRGLAVVADVADPEAVDGAVAATVERFGRLDAAHNNAGITGERLPTHDISVEQWRRTLDVNLTGVWLCMRAQIPAMLAGGGGAIVNTSSGSGLVGTADLSAYSASKFGIIGLTRSAAVELGDRGIRVNAICPGFVGTPMLLAFAEQNPDWLAERAIRGGRMARPDEMAAAVLWLCSDAASYINGVALPVDAAALA
jgi:NAD(P)-dependent dehydrogenase (short-subunit alcohol dehydrogenase family)